jgi:hypothetical protein
MHTKLVNQRNSPCDVDIGRPSIFGNPFRIGRDGTRMEVIQKYRDYFHARIQYDDRFRLAVEELRGKTLGCYCSPLPCHGDVIVDFLEASEDEFS